MHDFDSHRRGTYNLDVSGDGRWMVSAGMDRTLKFWDLARAEELRSLDDLPDRVVDVALDRDGRRLLLSRVPDLNPAERSTREEGGQRVEIWDVTLPALLRAQAKHVAEARSRLASDPSDPKALATLGTWYAARGAWDWAIALLERARARGARVSALTLARGHWEQGQPAEARAELARAAQDREAPADYLDLCLRALAPPGPRAPATNP
jgi:hypothetical protein